MNTRTTFSRPTQLAGQQASPVSRLLKLGAVLISAGCLTALTPVAQAADSAMAASSSASSGMSSPSAKAGVKAPTVRFMTKAAGAGMYEVEVSKLAVANASSADVKTYAQMLVDDHTMANNELKSLAQAKSVTLPTAIPKDKQAVIDRLGKMKGTSFDTAWIEQVGIKDHRADIALFDGYAKVPGDADVKAFASKTLPTLRHHLSDAQGLPKKMAGNMSGPHVVDAPKP